MDPDLKTEWQTVAFTVFVGIFVAYLFFRHKARLKEELTTGNLRDLRAKRLEQQQGQEAERGKTEREGSPKNLRKSSPQLPSDDSFKANQNQAKCPISNTKRSIGESKGFPFVSSNKDQASLTKSESNERSPPPKVVEDPNNRREIFISKNEAQSSEEIASVHDHDSIDTAVALARNRSGDHHDTILDDSCSSDMASKKRRKDQPAIQDLCQELTEAFSVCVRPKASPGAEWNGTEGWAKSTRTQFLEQSSSVLELPFADYEQKVSPDANVWERLYQALDAMSQAEPHILESGKPISMNWVVRAHGKLQTSSRPELTRCLKLVQSWVCRLASMALESEIKSIATDDDVPDLFANEVIDSNDSSPNLQNQLVDMLDNFSMSISCLNALLGNATQEEALVDSIICRLMKRLDDDAFTKLSVLDALSLKLRRINAVSHFMQSKSVQKHFATYFTKGQEGNGRDAEKGLPLHQLFRLAAYTVPATVPELQRESFFSRHFEDALAGESSTCAEIAVFTRNGIKGHDQFQQQSRQLMESARSVCRLILEKSMTASKGANKGKVFQWLLRFAELNLPLTKMLVAELLASDGIIAISSSWSFLNGLASSLVSICVKRLRDEFDKKKIDAFDHRFLATVGFRAICSESSFLSQSSTAPETLSDQTVFDGTTKFFFVASCLLHVSLYPMMRVEGSFRTHYNKPLTQLQAMAADPKSDAGFISSPVMKTAVRGWLGWSTFLEDPTVVGDLVNFALLQLQWLIEVVKHKSGPVLSDIPDWMCKEPSRWLTHVANARSLFIPHQAELTIEVVTRLLAAGSGGIGRGSERVQLSPVVLAELIHVVSAFVRSGLRKATKRDRGGDDSNRIDERSLYLSLDKNNLSSYVYTNEVVVRELCPVLMATFQVLDHVEGLNVDAEASFDKYSVKSEISRLLLILWNHPYDTRCKDSMLQVADVDLSNFMASMALVVGMLFDDGHQRFVDVCKSLKKQRLTHQERAFMERQKDRATNAFASSRGFLFLIWKLCLNDRYAKIMGGTDNAARDLAAMISTILGLVVQFDGGLRNEIDTASVPIRSAEIIQRIKRGEVEPQDGRNMVSTLVAHRRSVKKEYGLDVPLLACTLLAIAAKSTEASRTSQRVSPILQALASQDDIDVDMLRTLVNRYYPGGKKTSSVEEDVLRQDGYVGTDVWITETKDDETKLSGLEKQRRTNAARDHTSLEEIQNNVKRECVLKFIDGIESVKVDLNAKSGLVGVDPKVALNVLSAPMTLSDDKAYTDLLREWVVSSYSFSSKNIESGPMLHAFAHMTKSNATTTSGKVLQKEARKCHRNIPAPHPNSGVFVCFAEERLDICKCLITGPVDTPYALGVFEFDVYFPSSYPNIPPLMQFMTTGTFERVILPQLTMIFLLKGGGRVRFGPNLYLDGKVCLSLLGTFNAQDQSQQWNPKESSLPQILLSIQTQLLTDDPYFNEPGHESMRNTRAGRDASRSYNLKRSLDTLRYAIIEPLVNPLLGFEEVIWRHFALCRQQIVAQARRWTIEAKGTDLEKRFHTNFDRMVVALHNLPEEVQEKYPPLPPRQKDLTFLSRHGDSLFAHLQKAQNRKSLQAQTQMTMRNPWASTATNVQTSGSQGGGMGDADIEDFYT